MSSMDLINENKKKYKNQIIHFDIEFNLGLIATILWLNIPYPGGSIAACIIFAFMLLYLIFALGPNSLLNIWLDGVFHRINLRSLIRERKDRLYGWIFLSFGLFDYVVYYILYYLAGFQILACFCMIIGQFLKFFGLAKLYLGAKTIEGEKTLMWILLLSLGIFNSQIVYYFVSILRIIASH